VEWGQRCRGMGAAVAWNQWQFCRGIRGRIGVECAGRPFRENDSPFSSRLEDVPRRNRDRLGKGKPQACRSLVLRLPGGDRRGKLGGTRFDAIDDSAIGEIERQVAMALTVQRRSDQ